MAIANVTLNNTYDEWRTRTNQMIYFVNDVESGNLARFYSNSSVLTITQNISRTSNNFININVSSSILDTSTLNVATSNAVNSVHRSLTSSISNTNAILNVAFTQANNAFDKANAANVLAYQTGIAANSYTDSVGIATGIGANTYASATFATIFTLNGANTAVGLGANNYANNTFARTITLNGANTAIGAGANAYSNTLGNAVGAGANNYANATFATTVTLNGANTAVGLGANGWSNTVSVRDRTVLQDSATATRYVMFANGLSGAISTMNVASTLTFNPGTGTLVATNFNSTSDANKKINIVTLDSAMEILNDIRGVRFDWVENETPSIGVIAQEIETVLPELVSEGKSVNYNGLIAVLIEAVKELNERIKILENK